MHYMNNQQYESHVNQYNYKLNLNWYKILWHVCSYVALKNSLLENECFQNSNVVCFLFKMKSNSCE